MADLESLIRYRQYGVDEKRRVLFDLYGQAEHLAQQKKDIEEEIEAETIAAEKQESAESVAYLGRYLEASRKKIRALDRAAKKLETKIIIAQEDMRHAFAEMKKIEITQRQRQEQENQDKSRREDRNLDDVALENHRRQLDDE